MRMIFETPWFGRKTNVIRPTISKTPSPTTLRRVWTIYRYLWRSSSVIIMQPVMCLCTVVTSLADQYYQIFLAQGLAFGIGAGGVFTASMLCVGPWFVRQGGLATGIVSVGSSLEKVVFPIFLDRVKTEVGLYEAIRYTAVLVGVTLAIACCLLRARLPRKKWDGQVKWLDVTLLKEKCFALCTLGAFLGM